MEAAEAALHDALIDKVREAGIDVITDTEEGQRVLDEANSDERLQAKRRALETVSSSRNERYQQTVISSATGAKVLNNLDKLTEDYDKNEKTLEKTFVGAVANALGAKRHNSKSEYATFETKNGKIITIRLADHNATVSNFDNRGELDGISIVISPKRSKGINNDGNAHIIEYYYDAIKLRRAEGKPLADLVRSIKQALYSGEFIDTTGLAEVQEVNVDKDIRFFRISDGHAYGFTVGGKIYIDQRIATADTPIHEYAHLWASAMRKLNPKEWENIVKLMKGTPIWEEVKRNYPELTNDDDIADEVLAFYSGSRGVERLREEQKRITDSNGKEAAVNAINRVKEALKRFWKNVAEWFNVHFTTAEEVADKVLSDLLNGVNPTLVGVENDIRFAENSEEAEIVARAKADGTYMKAPNGKQSNLSPRQWVQVRTKAFKDWFGDWELSAKVLKVISGIKEHGFNSFEDAKAWAKENIVRTLTNEETGGKGEIRISNNAISKFLSESAVAKSDNKDVHLSVLRVLPDVIRESVDAEQHPDYKKGEDGNRSAENGINENVTIHRLYGAVDIDGKLYRVKVTLKEYTDSNRPRKAYSYEATKIELLAGTLVGGKPSNPNTNNSISAAKLLENVESSKEKGTLLDNLNGLSNSVAENQSADVEIEKGKLLDELDRITNPSSQENSTLSRYKDTRLFSILQTNSSKVVDENGEPLVVYHGTQSEFSSFDKDAILERKDGIKGFYFVPEKRRGSVAGYYANDKGKIMPIEMPSTRLEEKSKQENHPFEISELKNLVRELQSPIAVFKYGNNAKKRYHRNRISRQTIPCGNTFQSK